MILAMGAVISAVSKYRVDNVPLLLQPRFMLYGYGVGLVQELRDGRWTGLAPDGPGGPPRVAKRGVGHIAAQTGRPIVPLKFTLSRSLQMPTWDSKRLPLPFSTITLRFGQPIFVDQHNFDAAMTELAQSL